MAVVVRMKVTRPVVGKILQKTEGLGVPSAETVRRRAREIALIEGREKYTEQDWRRAFLELHGGHHDPLEASGLAPDDEMEEGVSIAEGIASSYGHKATRIPLEGEDNVGEELVSEGLDEALHDRMLQARYDIDLPDERE